MPYNAPESAYGLWSTAIGFPDTRIGSFQSFHCLGRLLQLKQLKQLGHSRRSRFSRRSRLPPPGTMKRLPISASATQNPVMATTSLVTFRHGVVANTAVLRRLWAIEALGCSFVLKDNGGFRVVHWDKLTPADDAFLRAHRDDVRRLIAYQADDSHLFTDQSQAQPVSLPDDAALRRTA